MINSINIIRSFVKIRILIKVILISTVFFIHSLSMASTYQRDYLNVKLSSIPRILINNQNMIRSSLPRALLGFNMNAVHFENDLYDKNVKKPAESLVDYLQQYPGITYRYPGGLIANEFDWNASIGPVSTRTKQKVLKHKEPSKILFGLQEFIKFIEDVDGQPVFVVNLSGSSANTLHYEHSLNTIVGSNREMAEFIKRRLKPHNIKRVYELGNELDRSEYEWSNEKYLERASAVVEAIRDVDKDAVFISPIRDFDWKYKYKRTGRSTWKGFVKNVANGINNDKYALHNYYGNPTHNKLHRLPINRLNRILNVIEYIRNLRKQDKEDGTTIEIWVTEHAMNLYEKKKNGKDKNLLTSNLVSSLETADMLIQMIMVPEIVATAWHAMNAGPWIAFTATDDYRVNPRPVTKMILSVLYSVWLPQVLETQTYSPNHSNYKGGYDIRAVAMRSKDGNELGLWIINRSNMSYDISTQYLPFRGKTKISNKRSIYLKDVADINVIDAQTDMSIKKVDVRFDEAGNTEIRIDPYSVTALKIS